MFQVPATMRAMLLTRHGGFDALHYESSYPVKAPATGEVLIKVAASSVNNTDINTRIGWYAEQEAGSADLKGGWGGTSLAFPRIQGTDICGIIVAVGSTVSDSRLGERVIVQACLASLGKGSVSPFVGSELDGGFAEYAIAPAADTYSVTTSLSDEELATLPCAYGTAENMLETAGVKKGDRVLITGASGNVGLSALLLAKLRGATVHALAALAKAEVLTTFGTDSCGPSNGEGLSDHGEAFDVVIDLVGGDNWNLLFSVMKPFGRLAISGAIGGASTNIDLRKIYLKNLRIFGCTEQTQSSFQRVISYVEKGLLKPPVHAVYPLAELVDAQKEFLLKQHVGKIIIKI